MKKLSKKILLLSLSIGALASCTPSESQEVCGLDTEYETPVTDSFKFVNEDSIRNDNFLTASSGLAIMEVKLASHTDGDTSNFYPINNTNTNNRFRLRYEAIDTPESTGQIEAWGMKASKFTKTKLQNAERIVLVNDLNMFEKYDSSGGRYMGFVWYKPVNADFRLLNLEIVEQGFSRNYLTQNSDILDGYFEAFNDAQKAAKNRRVNGELDCDFDSSKEVVETTIRGAKENFDSLGVDDTTGASGRLLKITAQVSAISGSDFYCRDLFLDEGQQVKTGIYVFTQYKTQSIQVGDVISFYGKITKYWGNYQITDLKINNDKYPFTVIAKGKEEVLAQGYDYDVEPYILDSTTISSDADFEQYAGNLVKARIKVNDEEEYITSKETSGRMTYTLHSSVNNVPLNIRFDSHTFFSNESTLKRVFERGAEYDVTTILGIFQYNEDEEGTYQLEFPDFKGTDYLKYVSKINK